MFLLDKQPFWWYNRFVNIKNRKLKTVPKMKFCLFEKLASEKPFTAYNFHSHIHYELYFLIDGSRTVTVENEVYHINANSLLCIPPYCLHKMEGGPYSRITVDFTATYLDDFQRSVIEMCSKQIIRVTDEEKRELLQILGLFEQVQSTLRHRSIQAREYETQICFSFLVLKLKTLSGFPTEKFRPGNAYSARTKKMIEYITKNFSKKITLDDLSALLNLSKTLICKEFKKDTGFSINEYLLSIRIAQAKNLLTTSAKTIAEVAQACGFASQNYFTVVFTEEVQMTPARYRQCKFHDDHPPKRKPRKSST